MSRANVELFWRTVEAFNSADVEGAVRACHADADNSENLDLFVTDYTEVRDLGDRILAIGTIRIRGRGSGTETDIPSALVLDFHDGKLARFQDHADRRRALEVVGLAD